MYVLCTCSMYVSTCTCSMYVRVCHVCHVQGYVCNVLQYVSFCVQYLQYLPVQLYMYNYQLPATSQYPGAHFLYSMAIRSGSPVLQVLEFSGFSSSPGSRRIANYLTVWAYGLWVVERIGRSIAAGWQKLQRLAALLIHVFCQFCGLTNVGRGC